MKAVNRNMKAVNRNKKAVNSGDDVQPMHMIYCCNK